MYSTCNSGSKGKVIAILLWNREVKTLAQDSQEKGLVASLLCHVIYITNIFLVRLQAAD